MRIVVDAMGSDNFPGPDVGGSVLAAREYSDIQKIYLVGDRAIIDPEIAKHNTTGLDIEVVHASEMITMEDKPSQIVKGKPNSSMHIGMGLVKDGKADAFVSAGNTGAALAIATLHLKRIRGVSRAALCATFKNPDGYTIMCDFGANAECRPEWLVEFGIMANLYAKYGIGIANPRVALLSNGEEEGKGNSLIHEALPLMKAQTQFNFVGPMEPKEVTHGKTDVIVHDGFTGNIMGKTLEACADMVKRALEKEIKARPLTLVGGALARPAFRRAAKNLDPQDIGGAILLGINGNIIIGHGRSNEIAIKNAIRQARQVVAGKVLERIKADLERTSAPAEPAETD